MKRRKLPLLYFAGTNKTAVFICRDYQIARNLESKLREVDTGRYVNITNETIIEDDADLDKIVEEFFSED